MPSVGSSAPQVDGLDRVTGRTPFVINLELPRMVHARILRSPHAHARIVRLDTAAAVAAPGVVAVVSRDDFQPGSVPHAGYGRLFADQDIVALDRVRYVGDIVAAVAATSIEAADEALALIDIEYEPLPAVFSIDEALAPDAPLVHDPRPSVRDHVAQVIIDAGGASNLCSTFRLRHGDVPKAMREAAVTRTDTFESQPVSHVALEPHACVVDFANGGLSVWTSAQMPHAIRTQLAETFELPLTRVQVIVGPVGGGFGAKGGVKFEPIAAVLAKKAGRPVKLVLRRDEEFVTLMRHPSRISITTGLTRDGLICAREVKAHYNTGAYADVGPMVVRNAGMILGGPYRIPAINIDAWTVWTNLVPAGAFRGFGVPQAVWAAESHMDALAAQAGIDPIELRARNVIVPGDTFATGQVVDDVHYERLLQSVTTAGVSPAPQPTHGRRRRGSGVALSVKGTITPSTSAATVRMNADGSVNVLTSSVDVGQGVRTILAQIASDRLTLELGAVAVSNPDTDLTPYDQQTSSSRTTFSMGRAVETAALALRAQLVRLASELLEAAVDDLAVESGRVVVVGSPDRAVNFREIIARTKLGSLVADSSFATVGGIDRETGQGIGSVHWHQGAASCEIEVDLDTGRIEILDLTVAAYVGQAINPRLCQLQVEGSAFFAIGQALFEDLVFDDGRVSNANLSDYNIPAIVDQPDVLRPLLLENLGPGDVHGIGETTLPPVIPAIGNALFDAIGVRLHELPLSPERVLRSMAEAGTSHLVVIATGAGVPDGSS